MHRVIGCFCESDGRPGWVFSVDREGRPADNKRDLYARAFVLSALASALSIQRTSAFESAVQSTRDFLSITLSDPLHGGFWDAMSRPDSRRRQNPHMHLLGP